MTTLDFSVVKRAGINYSEFGRMCGVNRATSRLWVKGAVEPRPDRAPHVEHVLHLIAQAIQSKRLPLKTAAQRQRDAAIKAALLSDAKRVSA